MSLFDEIKTGLNEAIEYEKGNLKAKTTTVSVEPVGVYTSSEIKSIRNSTGLTQNLFATSKLIFTVLLWHLWTCRER